jgi:diguanylate cyclase (GGDEF)-like protein
VTFCGESALRVAAAMERLRLAVSDHAWGAVAPNLKVTVSVGVARAPEYDALALIERADFAMYRAKRAGRNRLVLAK